MKNSKQNQQQVTAEQAERLLKDITAYWCAAATPAKDDRFAEQKELIDNLLKLPGAQARQVLQTLAETAPTMAAAAVFAAGPLEDYIDTAIKQASVDDARFIFGEPAITALLPLVWSDVAKLEALTDRQYFLTRLPNLLPTYLPIATYQEIMSYWCCLASGQAEYRNGYDATTEKLRNKSTRQVIQKRSRGNLAKHKYGYWPFGSF